jgi:hypothetical protein
VKGIQAYLSSRRYWLLLLAILIAAMAHREWSARQTSAFLEAEFGSRPSWAATLPFRADDDDFDRMTGQLCREGAAQVKRHARRGDPLEFIVFMRAASERRTPGEHVVRH